MQSLEGAASLRAGADASTEVRGLAFLDAALAAFELATSLQGHRTHRTSLAGRGATLRFAGTAMRDRLMPALGHLEGSAGAASLDVAVFDTRSTATPMPSPPWEPRDVKERGEIAGFNSDRLRTAYNVGSGILTVLDRTTGRAVVWAADASAVPYYETASPLRTLLSWWLEEAGLQVVHAAGVGTDGRGVLLTGRGGSGKTTTTLLCVEAGLAYAGDNNLVLSSGPRPVAHALFASATVRPDTLDRMPMLRSRLRNADRLATEKGLLFLDSRHDGHHGAPMLGSFDVVAVLLPRVVDAIATTLERASAGDCLAALAPSSILSLPGARAASFAQLAAFSRAVPAYHLRLAPDLEAIPALVRRVLEGCVT